MLYEVITIDSARFRINYSMAPGWMAVPQDCKPGWYRIKAFTSQMQNYDPAYAFSSWIRIDELIKENLVFNYRFNKKNYLLKIYIKIEQHANQSFIVPDSQEFVWHELSRP